MTHRVGREVLEPRGPDRRIPGVPAPVVQVQVATPLPWKELVEAA